MKFETFVGLIVHAIGLSDFKGSMLLPLLMDVNGMVGAPLNKLHMLLQNYMYHAPKDIDASGGCQVRVLYDRRKYPAAWEELEKVLIENKIAYRELSWGDNLIAERDRDEPTLLFISWSTVQSHWSPDYFCRGLARCDYRHTYAIFGSKSEYENWGGDPSAPHETLEHCESTKNFSTDIGITFKALLRTWQEKKYLIGISYAHEKEFDQERPAVELLKKFVECIQRELPEEAVLFDRNPTANREFNGDGALPATLDRYAQCKYFVILDDRYYDQSGICQQELSTIKDRLATLKGNRRLWLLHLRNEQHCKFYEEFRRDGGYSTDINQRNIEAIARQFVDRVKAGEQ